METLRAAQLRHLLRRRPGTQGLHAEPQRRPGGHRPAGADRRRSGPGFRHPGPQHRQRRRDPPAAEGQRAARQRPVRHGAALAGRRGGIRRVLPQLSLAQTQVQPADRQRRHRFHPERPRLRRAASGPAVRPGAGHRRRQYPLLHRLPGRHPPLRPELRHRTAHRYRLERRDQLPAQRAAVDQHRRPRRRRAQPDLPCPYRQRRGTHGASRRRPGAAGLEAQGSDPGADHLPAHLRPDAGRRLPEPGRGTWHDPYRRPRFPRYPALRPGLGVRRHQSGRPPRLLHQELLGLPRLQRDEVHQRLRGHQPDPQPGLVP
ncbi:hypothetical protein D3C80_1079810 [compost metagenome]